MGPDYLLVGVYKNKDTAIRAAKERAKEEDEYYKHSIENGLLDCDDYEETTIHFNEVKISEEPLLELFLFSRDKYISFYERSDIYDSICLI